MFGRLEERFYLCSVFFIVLDLRLTKTEEELSVKMALLF